MERLKAQKARENVNRMRQQQSGEKEENESEEMNHEDSDDSDQHDGLAQISDGEEERHEREHISIHPSEHAGMEESDGFVFAIHRRTVREREGGRRKRERF